MGRCTAVTARLQARSEHSSEDKERMAVGLEARSECSGEGKERRLRRWGSVEDRSERSREGKERRDPPR